MSKVLMMIGKGPSVVTAAWAGGLIVMAMRERVRASIDPKRNLFFDVLLMAAANFCMISLSPMLLLFLG
jgi:hypothetical protein